MGLIEEGPSQMGMGRRMRAGIDRSTHWNRGRPASSAVYVPWPWPSTSRGKAKVNLINIQLKPEAKS